MASTFVSWLVLLVALVSGVPGNAFALVNLLRRPALVHRFVLVLYVLVCATTVSILLVPLRAFAVVIEAHGGHTGLWCKFDFYVWNFCLSCTLSSMLWISIHQLLPCQADWLTGLPYMLARAILPGVVGVIFVLATWRQATWHAVAVTRPAWNSTNVTYPDLCALHLPPATLTNLLLIVLVFIALGMTSIWLLLRQKQGSLAVGFYTGTLPIATIRTTSAAQHVPPPSRESRPSLCSQASTTVRNTTVSVMQHGVAGCSISVLERSQDPLCRWPPRGDGPRRANSVAESNLALCSTSSGSENTNINERLRRRLGYDLEDLDELNLSLPGYIHDDHDHAALPGLSAQPTVGVMPVADYGGLYIQHWINMCQPHRTSVGEGSDLRSQHSQLQIFPIQEDNEDKSDKEGPPSPPKLSVCRQNSLDTLSVPSAEKSLRMSTASTSNRSCSFPTSANGSLTASSISGGFQAAPPHCRFSQCQDSLPPLRHMRLNPSCLRLAGELRPPLETRDTSTSTADLEELLGPVLEQNDMLDPRANPRLPGVMNHESGDRSLLLEPSGLQNYLREDAWMAPSCLEKIQAWQTSADCSTVVTTELEDPVFVDICCPDSNSCGHRDSIDNLRSVSQIVRPHMERPESRAADAMVNEAPRIRVIRPSGTSMSAFSVPGLRINKHLFNGPLSRRQTVGPGEPLRYDGPRRRYLSAEGEIPDHMEAAGGVLWPRAVTHKCSQTDFRATSPLQPTRSTSAFTRNLETTNVTIGTPAHWFGSRQLQRLLLAMAAYLALLVVPVALQLTMSGQLTSSLQHFLECLPHVWFGLLPYIYVHTNYSLQAALHGDHIKVILPWTTTTNEEAKG